MKSLIRFTLTTFSLFLLLSVPISLSANKTKVIVTSSSQKVKKGTEVTITIKVIHNANTNWHFTDWVYLKKNGTEVKKWMYDKNSLPEKNVFVLTYTMVIEENTTIEVNGNCNLHGSKGAQSITIQVE